MKKTIIAVILFSVITTSIFAQSIEVNVEPGENWIEKNAPQFAVWIEELDGTYCTTLYVTNRASKRSWIFAPKDGRPESLPVWYNASGVSTKKKDKVSSEIDAVSSASSKTKLKIKSDYQIDKNKSYVIKAEVNHSFDYNEFYQKKAKKNDANYSGVNGQPSLVYQGILTHNGITKLAIIGTGEVLGRNGSINPDLSKLTSALKIINNIEVSVNN